VLIVDHDAATRSDIEAALAPLVVRVVHAASGHEALEALGQREFALVVLDVELPGMDGFEVADRMRRVERTREVPILFVSPARESVEIRIRNAAHSAADSIVRPIDAAALRARVGIVVAAWRRTAARGREIESEAKAWRSELHRREEQLRLVLDGVHDYAISTLDADGRIDSINAAAERIKGYRLDEVRGQFFGLYFTDEDRALGIPAIELDVARRHGAFTGEGIRRRRDGSTFYAQVSLSALRDERGDLVGFVKVTHDITEAVSVRKRGEELLARLRESEARYRALYDVAEQERERAAAANRAKDAFLATLSHDLRTPLTSILGWTRMLQLGTVAEERRGRAIHTIDRNAKTLLAMIEDLLDVARIESGKLQVKSERVDVAWVVRAAVESMSPSAAEKQIEIRLHTSERSAWVLGETKRLQQVVWNLVSNAVKFTPPGGLVDVRIESTPGRVRICVQDTGRGIDPGFVPHVFDAFRQEPSSDEQGRGLGLGLAIVKRLVELHGGDIRADSEGLGRGATFVITLPAAPASDR
jgi:PAS domain S-box-containing protein